MPGKPTTPKPVDDSATPTEALELGLRPPHHDVFIIDDDKPLAEVFHQVLERRGLSTRTFGGRQALEEVPPGQWAPIMILDLSLGESDAIEVIQMLAGHHYAGTVALMSGRGEERLNQVQKIALRRGLTMLPPLAKPIRSDQIDRIVRHAATIEREDPPYDLAYALDADLVEFWYQPKVDLKSGATVGLEALARVRHPTAGVLSPADFLPTRPCTALDRLAERTITAACRDWSQMHAHGIDVPVSINASMSSLSSLEVIPLIRATAPNQLAAWPGLTIEITEAELIRDVDAAFELAVRLGLYKVDLAIDDFGKGFSSLSQVNALPFAEIKIDKDFVSGVHADAKRGAICEMTIALGHRFGRTITAEGIESTTDLDWLRQRNCDVGQGYYFGRPEPLSAIIGARGDRNQPLSA